MCKGRLKFKIYLRLTSFSETLSIHLYKIVISVYDFQKNILFKVHSTISTTYSKKYNFFFAYILEYVKKTIAKLPRNLSGAAGEYFSLQSKAFQIPVPQIVLRKQAKIVRINQ